MKKFSEFIAESKTPLEDGVSLHAKKDHDRSFQHKGEMKKAKVFDVHLHGHHIGSVETYSHQGHKKIGSSRLVKPMAPRVAWQAHSTAALQDKHGAGHYRSSMGNHSEHDAANNLARHFAHHIKKD